MVVIVEGRRRAVGVTMYKHNKTILNSTQQITLAFEDIRILH